MMTKHDWAVLGARILAIWVGINAAMALLTGWMGFMGDLFFRYRGTSVLGDLVDLLPLVLPLVLAWLCWTRAEWIAERIFPDDEPVAGQMAPTFERGVSIGVVLMGLYFIMSTLPEVMVMVFVGGGVSHPAFTAGLLRIGLGALMIFKVKSIVRFLDRVRTAGVRDTDGPPDGGSGLEGRE